jgi:hypothetical protein
MDSGRIFVRKSIKLSYQVTGIIVALLWLFQASAVAAIYKWKDDQGKLHFTDDRSKIPLKYRDQFEKFRGVAEPSPKESGSPEGAGAGSENGGTEAVQGEAPAGSTGGSEKAPEKSKYSKKQIELLKQVKRYMTKSWAGNTKIVNNIEPTELNGKYYISSAARAAPQKKGMIKQIGPSEIPLLQKIKKFLKKSSVNITKINIGGAPMMEKVQKIRKAMEAEIPIQKGFIAQLKKELGAEYKPPVDDPDAYYPDKPIPKVR